MSAQRRDAASQALILSELFAEASRRGDAKVRSVIRGSALVAVNTVDAAGVERTGLASRGDAALPPNDATVPDTLPESAIELASWLTSNASGPSRTNAASASIGLAATNALLPPPPFSTRTKAQNVIYKMGAGKRVAVVGHFPFVESMGSNFARLDVLELSPRPGDLPAEAAGEVLPRADVVAITGATLLNGALAGLLALTPLHAYVLVLGPSTPFAACLFDFGVDAVCGARVVDPALAAAGVAQGLPFKNLRGVEPLVWLRDEKKSTSLATHA